MRRIKAYVLTISDNEIMLSLGKEGEITMHYFEVSEIYKFPNGDILVKNANNSKGIHVPYCIELPNEVESLLASFKPLIVVPPPTK
ncbi:hypothetical protein [Chitinophaga skermanii]|nr:hypothetical protein [Chitinophaga skermanii]